MKILLVQLPTSHHGTGEKVYPIGLSRLSSLVPAGYKKNALDMNLFPDPWPEFKKLIENLEPEFIAFSLRNIDPLAGHLVSYLSSLKTAAALVRNIRPDSIIIAGGPAFSLFGARFMEAVSEIDYGLVGEGETSFPRIISKEIDPVSVPGLLWRKEGMIHSNPQAPGISMEEIPPMDTITFDPAGYLKGNAYVASLGIEGKRGCDLSCSYCVYPCLGGCKMRLRNPKKIVDEIESLHLEHGISLFHFTDSVVNRPVDHFKSWTEELIRRKLDISWTGFFREDSLDNRIVRLAMASGLNAIYFSADALTDHGLKILNKRLTKQAILKAAKITAENNILTMCHFLLNLPWDGDSEVTEAWEMLERLLETHANSANLGAVIFNHVRLYPDAALTKRLIKSGLLSAGANLLFPCYHNPPRFSYLLHEMEAHCHKAGVFSRLKPSLPQNSIMVNL